MKTKYIFKALALAMLMSAMLLTTACSNEDDVVNNTENIANKGYELPVTVNVTRQDAATTRATYTDNGGGTGSLSFSTGDQLFVYGDYDGLKTFAGTLTWQSGGTFSGTIYTSDDYSGTADELFSAADYKSATLLPNGYESIGFLSINDKGTSVKYDDVISISKANAFVASETAKATGVEQLSWEDAYSYSYSSGFALAPANAVLNFTISGLKAGAQDVTLKVTDGTPFSITGSVTPNASGVATFAIGVPNYTNIQDVANNLTIGSSNFTLPSNKGFYEGKIYNITRGTGATVDLSTKSTAYTAQNGETLTGTLASNVKISIADGATVTLNNVTINGTNDSNWAGITCLGNATIILSGTNTVKGFYNEYPGIYVPEGNTVTIKGSGSLTASSNGYAAGIGGGWKIACGNIEIQGGDITATGGYASAGIGSGNGSACGTITISGGTVTATGGDSGAGIGSGNCSACGTITISGGTVEATGGQYGAGIGSGFESDCGTINIASTVIKVTATKGSYAPNSIGAGDNGSCGTVTIEDGSKVTQN